MKPLAAITGGTGFVGRHVLKAFADAGWRVRVLTRQEGISDNSVELVKGSLNDKDALTQLVTGADVVIHLAGAIKARSHTTFHEVNATGTQTLVNVVENHAPFVKLVMLSSLAAREPDISAYASSKRAGERFVEEASFHSCILRPSAIYGPEDRETLAAFRAASLPYYPLANDETAQVCLIHASDVAQAILTSATAKDLVGNFEISDNQVNGYTWHEIGAVICEAMARPYRPFVLPKSLIRLAGKLGDIGNNLFGMSNMLTQDKAKEILHKEWSSFNERQIPRSVWQPKIPINQGFQETVEWYRAMRWLP